MTHKQYTSELTAVYQTIQKKRSSQTFCEGSSFLPHGRIH